MRTLAQNASLPGKWKESLLPTLISTSDVMGGDMSLMYDHVVIFITNIWDFNGEIPYLSVANTKILS